MDKSLGSRLIIARKGRNLSQKKLAEMVKKSQSTIAALETGKGTMIYDGNTAALLAKLVEQRGESQIAVFRAALQALAEKEA